MQRPSKSITAGDQPPATAARTLLRLLTIGSRPAPTRHRRLRGFLAVLCWLYTAIVIAIACILHQQGDRWWPATLFLFGPRWIVGLPLILLLPIARFGRHFSLSALIISVIVLLFPVMNLQVPVSRLLSDEPRQTLRILTCNTHGKELDPKALARVIEKNNPDIVALQEWYSPNTPIVLSDPAWHIIMEGELCLATRFPVRRVEAIGGHRWKWNGAATRFEIDAPTGTFSFINVHLESPHVAFLTALHRSPQAEAQITRNSEERLKQAAALMTSANAIGPSVVLAGDFNLPADSTIYRQTLAPLNNAFNISGLGFGWTYYVKWTVTRIDHILTGNNWRPVRCWPAEAVGSPHRPLIADLEWVAGSNR